MIRMESGPEDRPLYLCRGVSGTPKNRSSMLCLYFGDTMLYASDPSPGDYPWLWKEEKQDIRYMLETMEGGAEFVAGKPPGIIFLSADGSTFYLENPNVDLSIEIQKLIDGDGLYLNEGDSMFGPFGE